MPNSLTRHGSTVRRTPQNRQARPDQVKNNAGGYTFEVDQYARLHRFLTIGSDGGTYHVGEKALTGDNIAVVQGLAVGGDHALIDQAVAVSLAGRAPRNDWALYAIAAAASVPGKDRDPLVAYKQRALGPEGLQQVARTGTHTFQFLNYVLAQRSWGAGLVRGIREWYLAQPVDQLAYQLLKYKSRERWSQRDVLRLVMRKSGMGQHGRSALVPREYADLFAYVMNGTFTESLPPVVHAAAAAHATRKVREWVKVIEENRSLSWEMLPSEALAEAEVWQALIRGGNLPPHAFIRELARLTNLGVLRQGDAFTISALNALIDPARLQKARVHPITLLLALKTYAQGHGVRGSRTWTPVPQVTDALDAGFYNAFPAVEPSGVRIESAVDISGTMTQPAGGLPVSCREAAAAMSLVTAGTEPRAAIYGFGDRYQLLDVSRRRRLDDTMSYMASLGMQRTDCALPMVEALRSRREVDVFQILTDNETWHGTIHPHQALEEYRQKMGIDARLQVVAFVPTRFSIADPLDPRQLDVSGFDAAVPNLLTAHARGDL